MKGWWLIGLSGCVTCFSACTEHDDTLHTQHLQLPPRQEAYITDHMQLAGQSLTLWRDGRACQLTITPLTAKSKKLTHTHALQPSAPCYFINSPGSDRVQVYQQDKTTRVVAVLGGVTTVVTEAHCGGELQGLIIHANGRIEPSKHLHYRAACVDKGLDNAQYSLFVDA